MQVIYKLYQIYHRNLAIDSSRLNGANNINEQLNFYLVTTGKLSTA